jgi:methyl-accepting chemotaxis protein
MSKKWLIIGGVVLVLLGAFFLVLREANRLADKAHQIAIAADSISVRGKAIVEKGSAAADLLSAKADTLMDKADTLVTKAAVVTENVEQITDNANSLKEFYKDNDEDFARAIAAVEQLSESGKGLLDAVKEGKGAVLKGKELWRSAKDSPAKDAVFRLSKAAEDRKVDWTKAEQEYRQAKKDGTWHYRYIPDGFWKMMKHVQKE